ncbi:hypothetical protein OIU77_009074 [Salix suchowensis]|uniref:Uncharacterized protein n=1 Tax=Salix suchowensis TaxID=1278906 RepID=A0ABQ9ADC7_9ROSI|nr:hypothetical protein OIU77_009074 [Salix suchowensis]
MKITSAVDLDNRNIHGHCRRKERAFAGRRKKKMGSQLPNLAYFLQFHQASHSLQVKLSCRHHNPMHK